MTYLDSSLFAGSAAVARLCVGASSGHFAINHQSSIINQSSTDMDMDMDMDMEERESSVILVYSILFIFYEMDGGR